MPIPNSSTHMEAKFICNGDTGDRDVYDQYPESSLSCNTGYKVLISRNEELDVMNFECVPEE